MAGPSITSYRLKNGEKRWRVQFYYTNWQGKRVKKKFEGQLLKRDALEKYNDFMEKMAPTSNMPFSKLYAIYMESLDGRDALTTIEGKKYAYRTYVLPYFGEKPINTIDAQFVETFFDELRKRKNARTGKPLADGTQARVRGLTAAVFNFAVHRGFLSKNPIKSAPAPLKVQPVDPKTIWTVDEFNHMLTWFDARPRLHLYRLALVVLFWTGCRIGECLALTPADFDFDVCQMHITKTREDLKGHAGGLIKAPKTKTSNRTVPVPPKVCNAVKGYIDNVTGMMPGTLLFPFSTSTVSRYLKQAAEETGLPHITLHGLRHSYASMLINRGEMPQAVQKILGHATLSMTTDVYSHIYEKTTQKVALDIDKDVKI